MDFLSQVARPDGRRDLVRRFHAWHLDEEAALAPWLAGVEGLEFDSRRRSRPLSRDLAALGVRPLAAATRPPHVASRGEALGRLYVLEGSTLGGRVIRKALTAQGQALEGLSFLDPYGERVGERWRTFLDVLDAEGREASEADAMVAGALAAFRDAERRLCGPLAHV